MRVGTRPGPFNKNFIVRTNDSQQPSFSLKGTVQVLAAIQIDPMAVSFGDLPRTGGPQERTVRIRRGDAGPLRPEIVPNPTHKFESALREIVPGEEYELTVRIEPPWPPGGVRGQLVLKTGVPEQPQAPLTVMGIVRPVGRAMPASLRAGPGFPARGPQPVRIVWQAGQTGRITGASASDPAIAVRIEGEGATQRVDVELPTDYAPAQVVGQKVVITTDHAELPTIEVPILVLPARPIPGQQPTSVRDGVPLGTPTTQPAAPTGTAAVGAPARG